MKKLSLFGCAALALVIASPALAEEIKADCALKAATVYTDRAMLTCAAKVNVPSGKHVVVFDGLPRHLYGDSLRAEGQGSHAVTLGALTHKVVNQARLVNEKEQTLKQTLEGLETQKQALQREIEALETQKGFYSKLLGQAADSAKEEISIYEFNTEKWVAAGQTIYKAVSDVEKAQLDLRGQIKVVDESIRKTKDDLQQIRTGNTSTLEVRLPVEASAGGQLTLDLSYQMGGASWRPVYDARLETVTGKLELVQYGAVVQRTGMDWDGVALTLSTAQPARGANVPDLRPMWVGLGSKRSGKTAGFASIASNISNSGVERAFKALSEADSAPSADEEMVAAAPQAAVINAGGFTAEYEIPGLSSVASDGSEAKLYIGAFENESDMKVHIKPQYGRQAYLVAHTTLGGEATFLPGKINLFRDNAYIGQSYRSDVLKPGQDIELSFGVDDQVELTRKVLKDQTSEQGMFVGSSVIERRFSRVVKNLRDKPVQIVLDETVPEPKDKKIEVRILQDATSAGYERNADKVAGLMRWEFTLEPSKEKEILLGWQLKWPEDENIYGVQ